ncbi:MAG TPA: DNA mismatch repair protein MutS, partial [Burkholderiales bacterium]|nr:DNA mismatch repair protein MutS [Burkholderiales bacterium]
ALAWAVARHLVEKNASLTLFATHYFELTRLAQEFRQIANVHLDAVEHKDRIVFLHSVEDGPASQSYGLQVAGLAGIPPAVIRAARKYLVHLEEEGAARDPQGDLFSPTANIPEPPEARPLVAQLNELDPDTLTPRDALEWIYRLKREADEGRG